jgi:5-methylcytosine-specific restriction protein A
MPSRPPKRRPPQTRPPFDDTKRPNAHQRGYTRRWQRLRLSFLRSHPLCAACASEGLVKAASDVDHIVPHRGDSTLFWDMANLQSLCASCHARKTARGE